VTTTNNLFSHVGFPKGDLPYEDPRLIWRFFPAQWAAKIPTVIPPQPVIPGMLVDPFSSPDTVNPIEDWASCAVVGPNSDFSAYYLRAANLDRPILISVGTPFQGFLKPPIQIAPAQYVGQNAGLNTVPSTVEAMLYQGFVDTATQVRSWKRFSLAALTMANANLNGIPLFGRRRTVITVNTQVLGLVTVTYTFRILNWQQGTGFPAQSYNYVAPFTDTINGGGTIIREISLNLFNSTLADSLNVTVSGGAGGVDTTAIVADLFDI
jgi:hypothetical protein